MKAYVITTGIIFGLLALVHLWRVAEEGMHLARAPSFVFSTVAAVALCVWAWRLTTTSSRP